LSLDSSTLAAARELAKSRGTTLNQMIRNYLAEATAGGSPEEVVKELDRLWAEGSGHSRDWAWNREESHERSVLR